jgi:hypothetical protein
MIDLGLGYSNEWESYSDEEILMLPYDTPQLIGQAGTKSFGPKVRPSLFPLRIFLLRDILMFDGKRSPKFSVIDLEKGKILIKRRFHAFPPKAGIPEFKGDSGAFHNAKSAMAHVRKTWTEAWNKDIIPREFKARLERITKLPENLKNMQAPWMPFKADEVYSLILWHKLTLNGVLCKNYTVKGGRLAGLKPTLLTPHWIGIGGVEGADSEDEEERVDSRRKTRTTVLERKGEKSKELEGTWTRAWKLLNWKYRPASHHEAYWQLLHKRPRRARGGVDAEDPKRAFRTGFCYDCGQKDTSRHAYVECPEVRRIWASATQILEELIGATSVIKDSDIQLCQSEIVLGFPELRKRIPEIFRERVIAWHSAIVYVIWACREWSLDHREVREGRTCFKFYNCQSRIRTEIRAVIHSIFEKETNLGQTDRFKVKWENSSRFVGVSNGRVVFDG